MGELGVWGLEPVGGNGSSNWRHTLIPGYQGVQGVLGEYPPRVTLPAVLAACSLQVLIPGLNTVAPILPQRTSGFQGMSLVKSARS